VFQLVAVRRLECTVRLGLVGQRRPSLVVTASRVQRVQDVRGLRRQSRRREDDDATHQTTDERVHGLVEGKLLNIDSSITFIYYS